MRAPPTLLGLARSLSAKRVSCINQASSSRDAPFARVSLSPQFRRHLTPTASTPAQPDEDPTNSSEAQNPDEPNEVDSSEGASELVNPETQPTRVGRKGVAGKGSSKSNKSRSGSSKSAQMDEEESAINRDTPKGLLIWTPTGVHADPSGLPPAEMLEEALNNLNLALHPHTQRQAINSPMDEKVEPSIALYCPIEGGLYVLDATVQELAHRTNADVSVIDGAQLLAGQWGQYATAFQLSQELLQFCRTSSSNESYYQNAEDEDEELDEYDGPTDKFFHHLSRHFQPPRGPPGSAERDLKLMLDALVQAKPPGTEDEVADTSHRPRIIYVRDLITLQPSSATWYPYLLQAVHNRRTTNSSFNTPTVIIFGVTPQFEKTQPPPGHSRRPPSVSNALRVGKDGSHHEAAGLTPKTGPASAAVGYVDRARERRLKAKLRKWERGDPSLYDDFPSLLKSGDQQSGHSGPTVLFKLLTGPVALSAGPPQITQFFQNPESKSNTVDGVPGAGNATSYFRTSFLLPSKRSIIREKQSRVDRRRETNDLLLRMAVGTVGGVLEAAPLPLQATEAHDPLRVKWDDWMKVEHSWAAIREIADRAIGSALSTPQTGSPFVPLPQNPTPVPWSAVYQALVQHRASRQLRQAWLKSGSNVASSLRTKHDQVEEYEPVQDEPENEEREDAEDDQQEEDSDDDIIERVKEDPTLSNHERRLLSCIVNPGTMPTSFAQVHLPAATIDAVRTIVSLPLLHPEPFRRGVLKENSMTGALLFGPPGVGKTLMARALAKEAGCRMMIVRASDVNDMYVGEGEKLIKSVFTLARRLSPCVVFLDEIDALLGQRASGSGGRGSEGHHRSGVTEWMQEMDGLRTASDEGVIVIGATNRPYDLDDAVLRRLPRRLLIDLPGEKDREAILKILLRDEKLGLDVDLSVLAKKTDTFSGSDLKHLCVAAALKAVKESVGHDLPWAVPDLQPKPDQPVDTTLANTPEKSDVAAGNAGAAEANLNKEQPDAAEEKLDPSITLAQAESIATEEPDDLAASTTADETDADIRVLTNAHFLHAFKEISPSSSEFLGSMAALRKWNETFGEGAKQKKRVQVWGKDRFGFIKEILEESKPEA